jgi:signal peptidase
MSRHRSTSSDDDPADAPEGSRTHRSGRRRHDPAGPDDRRRAPVRRWDGGDEETDATDDAEGAPGDWRHRPKRPVFFRARDSLYFEPLVALAVILLLLVSLWAFTQNWPPMYVIESSSMQHGTTDQVGLINTGDLVLIQKVPFSAIVPYVVGLRSGYSTYGEYGDVVLYHPDGSTAFQPIIHRAIIYLQGAANGTFNVPSLTGLPCGPAPNAVYSVSSSPTGCGTVGVSGTLVLHHIGWRGVDVSIPLDAFAGTSGLVTMGDNNIEPGSPLEGAPDQPARGGLVEPSWIVGVARGMLPWFGSAKLLLEGNAQEVPPQSWQYMGITILALLLGAFAVHYALREEGIEDPRRKADEEEAEERAQGEEEDGEPPEGWHPLGRWHSRRGVREEPPEESPETTSASGRTRPIPTRKLLRGRGRPPPDVRRLPKNAGSSKHRVRSRDGPQS